MKKIERAIAAFNGNLVLSAETLNVLSARTLNGLSARREEIYKDVPLVENPYTNLLNDINSKKRKHNQADYGPKYDPKENLCGTQMCTAGHLINMGGESGYALLKKCGSFSEAATLIHLKSCPDMPLQNFGGIEQSHAMAYIELMAEFEQRPDKSVNFSEFFELKLIEE